MSPNDLSRPVMGSAQNPAETTAILTEDFRGCSQATEEDIRADHVRLQSIRSILFLFRQAHGQSKLYTQNVGSTAN